MRNPYIIDRPLNDQDMFVGRGAILEGIPQGLAEGERLFLLYGKPRIGKTSLLNQLELRLSNIYQVILLPWPGLNGESPLWRLIELIAQACGQPPPERTLVTAALEALHSERAP